MSRPKIVRGALPCGNPERYTSSEVVQMQKNDQKLSNPFTGSTSEDQNQSESDQYIKTLLKRQIHTDVTINQQFSQHRDFTESSSHAPSVTQLRGLHSTDEHDRLDKFDATIEYLNSCGLTRQEIAFKLKDKISIKTESSASHQYRAHPVTDEVIIKEIERKLAEKEEALNKPDTFNGGLELSRHALVLEKAILERQNKEASLPEFLFREKKMTVSGHPDDPINHLAAIMSDIEPKPSREPRRERRRKRKLNQKLIRQQQYLDVDSDPKSRQEFMQSVGQESEPQSNCISINTSAAILNNHERLGKNEVGKELDKHLVSNDGCPDSFDDSNFQINSEISGSHDNDVDKDNDESGRDSKTKTKKKKKNPPQNSGFFTLNDFSCDIRLVTDADIQSNRISLSEILSMSKFQHYEQGNPSRTVFVKNISKSVEEIDLVSVFGRYEHKNASPIQFRLLNGRMKGQAFVTFPDINTAKDVIRELNGYKLHGRPMILSFGKQQIDSHNESIQN